MAYVNVLTVPRLGSYQFEMLIDDYTINNTELFQADGLGWYGNRNFIKPVGFIAIAGTNSYNVCVMAKIANSSSNCIQWYQVYSGHSISYAYKQGGILQGTITPENFANINFYNVIPWFNNIDDASKYSRGDEFNANNWIGGLDVRVQYTWQSVAGVYGKSGHVVFSHVLDDTILTGSDINDLNADAFAFYGATRIDRLIANAPTGTEVTAFYSGDFNHLTVTKGELSLYVTLKMYVEGHIVEIDITKPTNTDGWASGFLGYIIDSENQVAKLVYIKEQGNALLLPTGVYDLTRPGT